MDSALCGLSNFPRSAARIHLKSSGRFFPGSAFVLLGFFLGACMAAGPAQAQPATLQQAYAERVVQQLAVPADELARYDALLEAALAAAGVDSLEPQYIALVDRNPQVQSILILWRTAGRPSLLIGASPVSTGKVGRNNHFETPLGVFLHGPANPDYRALGTRNELGFRGYGSKGMRIYDLGWQQARRGWGKGGTSTMRLQMHATDPDMAQPLLGSVRSEGCIRIPASLNRLLDLFGVLDAEYEVDGIPAAAARVLDPARTPVQQAGRYIVVVDSLRGERPAWAPSPLPLPLPSSVR